MTSLKQVKKTWEGVETIATGEWFRKSLNLIRNSSILLEIYESRLLQFNAIFNKAVVSYKRRRLRPPWRCTRPINASYGNAL